MVRVRVEVYGNISARHGSSFYIELEGEPSVEELVKVLAEKIPEALTSDGTLRPGMLVFINGADIRVLDKSEKLKEPILVQVVQVFHGG